MKKNFIVICCMLSIILTACGGGKPAGMNDDDYKIGIKVYETLNGYLDGSISKKDAKETLEDLEVRLTGTDRITNEVKSIASFSPYFISTGNIPFIKDYREKLKEMLNR